MGSQGIKQHQSMQGLGQRRVRRPTPGTQPRKETGLARAGSNASANYDGIVGEQKTIVKRESALLTSPKIFLRSAKKY